MSIIPRFRFVYQYLNRSLETFADALSPYITVENGLPYKVYTAKLTQNGTNDPTVTVLQNTLGFNFTFSRSNIGRYTTNQVLVDAPKTTITCSIGGVPSPTIPVTIFANLANAGAKYYFNIETYVNGVAPNLTDGILQNSVLEIRVYN